MCEQTEVVYLEGDVVWVKLGPCWWPGEVKNFEKIDEDIKSAFKKPPIAVVKFFQEDKFEYVKNINNIYKYNCRRKNDFIKKGLDLHRKENVFMEKFPSDIAKAEELTGGDPDIVSSNLFAPEQKPNYAQLFGTPSPKKTPKYSGRGRPSLSAQKSAGKNSDKRIIHPRFIGKSDYHVTLMEQSTPPPSTSQYNCHMCNFTSTRLNVIVLHNRSHSSGYISNVEEKKVVKKRGRKATKSKFANTSNIDEDIELIRQGFVLSGSDTSDVESEDEGKAKAAPKRTKTPKAKAPSPKKARVSPSAICSNLLADWSDNEDQETEELPKESKTEEKKKEEMKKTEEKTKEDIKKTEEKNKDETKITEEKNKKEAKKTEEKNKETKKSDISNELLADWDDKSNSSTDAKNSDKEDKQKSNENGKDSCFDFKEEEVQMILQKSPGRKIPRVIPQKRKSSEISNELETEDTTKNVSDDTTVIPEIPQVNSPQNKEEAAQDAEIDDKIKNLLEETAVPDVPTIDNLKSAQNFPLRRPIKSPDKKDEEKTNGVIKETDSITECPIPKKRFTRNFEDFEMFHNEQKDDPPTTTSKSGLEVSKLKTQLMTKLQDQNVSPPKEKPRRNRRKSKLSEKTDYSENIEVRKEVKPSIQETVVEEILNKSTSETTQQPVESKEEINSLDVPQIIEDSSNKNETIQEEVKTLDIGAVEMESTQDSIAKDEISILEKDATLPTPDSEPMEQELESKVEDLPPNIEQEPLTVHEQQEEVQKNLEIPEEPKEITEEPKEITEEPKPEVPEIPEECKIQEEESQEQCTLEHIEEVPKALPEEQITEQVPEETTEHITEEVTEHDLKNTSEHVHIPHHVEEYMPEKVTAEVPEFVMEQAPEQISEHVLEPIHTDVQEHVLEQVQEQMPEHVLEQVQEQMPEQVMEDNLVPEQVQPVIEEIQENVPVPEIVQEQVVHEEEPIQEEKLETELPNEDTTQNNVDKSKVVMDISDIHIDNTDNLSGLATLATVSELSDKISENNEQMVDFLENVHEEQTVEEKLDFAPLPPKKVATLANFSMDFSDSNESLPLKKDEVSQEIIQESENQIVNEENNLSETVITETDQHEVESDAFHPFSFIEENVVHEEYIEKTETEKPETIESEMAKLTNTSQEAENVVEHTNTSSKLLEILTDTKGSKKLIPGQKTVIQGTNKNMLITSDKGLVKIDKKYVIKSKTPSKQNKPIILSEKIIKPITESDAVSVKKVTSKRTYQDVEDIDTFIIQKPAKKSNTGDDMRDLILTPKSEVKQIRGRGGVRGKPKIIEQTIIKPSDGSLLDDSMFDINSMPIVLSDQILTPESIENMPVVFDLPGQSVTPSTEKTPLKRGGSLQKVKMLNKSKTPTSHVETPTKIQQTLAKNLPKVLTKNQKVYASSSKIIKNSPAVITQPGKPGKFIILPTSSSGTPTGSKYTVGKRLAVKTPDSPTTSKVVKSLQGLSGEPSGNKIMIVTNNQGVQSRVLLTPAQQKVLAGKMPATKITKGQTQVKGNIIHPKSILTSKGTLLPVSSSMTTSQKSQILTQAIMTSKGQIIPTQGQTLVTSEGQVLTPLTPQQLRNIKGDAKGRKLTANQRIILPDKSLETTPKGKIVVGGKKTILLKGQGGQTYKKIIPTSDTKTVFMSGQKQLVSISGQQLQQAGVSGKQLVVTSKGQLIKTDKLTVSKAGEKINIQKVTKPSTRITKGKSQMIMSPSATTKSSQSSSVPPLAPITAKKTENVQVEPPKASPVAETKTEKESTSTEQKQLIIQDNLGNQTTVTEGQILALPRESVDGQPQSYMLVTVDESGNLAPLSNEALMSLEPGLALGGDMNNLVLQFDQPPQTENQPVETKPEETVIQTEITPETVPETSTEQQLVSIDGQQVILDQPQVTEQVIMSEQQIPESYEETQVVQETAQPEQQTLACNISTGETSQQLIITGDPETTQKFLASLSEGNTDLSSLLTGAEGNIIINADGQQILLNTGDPENQILLMPSQDVNQSAIYDNQIKNQDILAAALADTDVFQQDSQEKDIKTTTSQLSPGSGLYPMNVGNVLETSLTLGSPIMTPLEVPSNKTKKHDIESTLLTQVPTSLELPITITDPSISQTVSQQVMLTNELQSNLELPISVGDTITSTEMSSPNFVYSLPSLEENSEIETKTCFSESPSISTENIYSSSMSMPLLTEEPEISHVETEMQPQTEIEKSEEKVELETEIQTQEVGMTSEEVTTEIAQEPSTSFAETLTSTYEDAGIQDESVVQMTQKISNTLEISPIEDDLDFKNSDDMCDSLSEPPPGMFEKESSFLADSYLNKPEENNDIPMETNMPVLDEKKMDFSTEPANVSEDLPPSHMEYTTETSNIEISHELPTSELSNSEVNSPRLDIDETSCEIPPQPTIVTNLTDNLSQDFEDKSETDK